MAGVLVIERSQIVAALSNIRSHTFSDPRNVPAITPPWLPFTVTHPSEDRIFAGCEIDYTIRWLGVPLRWTTRITEYEPNVRFTDEQRRGSYAHRSHSASSSRSDTRWEWRATLRSDAGDR